LAIPAPAGLLVMLWHGQYSDWDCAWDMKKMRFSSNISFYLGNDTKYGHSYYGLWNANELVRDLSKGVFFQWPLGLTQNWRSRRYSTLNISETVRDRDISYNRILIGAYTYAYLTAGCHFEWPWVTICEMFNDTKHRATSLRQFHELCKLTGIHRIWTTATGCDGQMERRTEPEKLIIRWFPQAYCPCEY